MHHVIELGISIDDNEIKEEIKNEASRQLSEDLIKDIEKALGVKKGYYDSAYCDDDSELVSIVNEIIQKVCEDNKDQIIDKVIANVSDKLVRSKAFKSQLLTVLEKLAENSAKEN